jgi:hypothetical protein
MQVFPGAPVMAMPPQGAVLAGQQPQHPAPSDGQNPGHSVGENEPSYESKLEIAHKNAVDAATRDAKRACQPSVNVPFADLDDAIARLLPYHVFSAPDEDELDMSVVPPVVEGASRTEDDERNEAVSSEPSSERPSSVTTAPARSRAQAWAESRVEFVRAFIVELASKRERVGANSKSNPEWETSLVSPKRRRTPGAAEEYLVAAKTLEVAKRRDAAEKAARALELAEKRRLAEVERQRQQAKARAEAEQRRAAQAEAQRRKARADAEAHARARASLGSANGAHVSSDAVLPSTVVGFQGVQGAAEKPAERPAEPFRPRSTVVGPAIVVRAPESGAQNGGAGGGSLPPS